MGTVVARESCSFCGKPGREVAKLIAGPGVYICNECVGLCNDILAQAPAGRSFTADWVAQLDDASLLEHLGRVATMHGNVEGSLRDVVNRLRDRSITWARIGEALGMTRQSAWERFSNGA